MLVLFECVKYIIFELLYHKQLLNFPFTRRIAFFTLGQQRVLNIIIIIIIINVIYMAQIRRMQQIRHVDCYRRYSLCHEKCFQPCTEDRQRHDLG